MLCDYYELTMGNGYFANGMKDKIVYFDVFYRDNPDNGGYAIVAGLEQVVEYIKDLHFDEGDIEYLRGRGCFCEEFLEYLRTFKFSGDIWAIPEGTVVFPGEPLMIVRAPIVEAQFIETYVLMMINHQSLIATKASRITRAAKGRGISEFGSRRAQGADAAILGARAAYIGGCGSTACTIADEAYGVPAVGTMAHSWVQLFDTEYEAFETYCKTYPKNATLLVDTYNVLESGVPNAIKAFKTILHPQGIRNCAVRIDSGDVTYLTKKVRKMLDEMRPKIHGMVHCTGGAQTKVLHFVGENCRVIKDNMFPVPPLFKAIHDCSGTDWAEMYKVFNMGHRLEVYVAPEDAEKVIAISKSFNIDAQVVGRVEEGKKSLLIKSEFGEFEY